MADILLLNEKGDEPIATFDKLDRASVDAAIKVLEKQWEQGRAAYSVVGDTREIIHRGEFPIEAEKIIVMPALQGG